MDFNESGSNLDMSSSQINQTFIRGVGDNDDSQSFSMHRSGNDGRRSVDTEQLQFEISKKEFNVKKVQYEHLIKELQTEKLQMET